MKFSFIIIIAILLLALAYVSYRLWVIMPVNNPLKACLVTLNALLVFGFFGSIMTHEQLPIGVSGFIYKLGTAWIIILLYLIMAFLLTDIARLLIPAIRPYFVHHWGGTLGIAAALTGLFVYANINFHHKVRVPLDLTIDKALPRPIKIVAVSDLHLGYTIGRDELSGWVDLLNAEKPDLILIAGDVVDNSVRPLSAARMHEELRRLHAPMGVYACLGNHEYLGNEPKSQAFLQQSGVTLLKDSAVLVDSMFYVVGRDDRMNPRRQPLSALTATLDKSKPILVLDHQPYDLQAVPAAGADFQLSGHTHHGQVFPLNFITDALYERAHGYLRKDKAHIYVSSGLGIWGGKFRIGTQSEYAVITLYGQSQ